jgi:SNF2 family DNA or RNA helicase
MSALKISMSIDSKVRIEPDGLISDGIWEGVIDWWALDGTGDAKSKFVDIGIPEFAQRKLWLRENWTSLGYRVNISDDVKTALKTVDGLMAKFIEIAGRNDADVESVNLDLIPLIKPLTEFQKKTISSLIGMPNGANFSVPGAGKTLTTLALWEYFRISGSIERMLIVCPRSAFEAWESDSNMLERHPAINLFNDEPIDLVTEILYVNYEQLENERRLSRLIKWVSQKSTMLVIDEAHRIKGGGASIRWRACRELSNHSARVDLLTGTPMPQSQEDLRNLLSLSWSGVPREFFSDSRLSALRRGGVFVRTTKKELQLPIMKITSIELPMSRVQKDVYSALRQSFIGQFEVSNIDSSYFTRRGKAVMTLIAAATNPGLLMRSVKEDAYLGLTWPPRALSGSERLMSVLEEYAAHEIPEKYQWVARYVAKASKEGRKVLIWSTFIANLLTLKRLLEPYDPALIYGISSQDERKAELLKFRTSKSCSVLLSNPQTLGEGVSLHKECHDAIYIDRNYNAGLYLQSLDRIHRLGLPSDQETNIFILQCEGSIDQRIARRLEDKIQRLGFYLNDAGLVEVSLPGLDDEILPDGMLGMDQVDLNDIYQHLTGND